MIRKANRIFVHIITFHPKNLSEYISSNCFYPIRYVVNGKVLLCLILFQSKFYLSFLEKFEILVQKLLLVVAPDEPQEPEKPPTFK